MKNRLLYLLFAACLTCSLCACGNDSGAAPSKDAESGNNSISDALPTDEHVNTHRARIKTSYGPGGELYYRQEYIYGAGARYASVTSYRSDGSESGHVNLTYNEQGDRLNGYAMIGLGRSTTSDAPLPLPILNEVTGKVFLVQYEYEYDNEGRIIKQTETDSEYGGGTYTYEYDYDSTGKKVCSRMYRENASNYQKTLYEYDTNGNLTTSKEYLVSAENPDGRPFYMTLYEYDGEGREIKNEQYVYSDFGEEQSFNRRTEKEYTEEGKLLKISYYDADGLAEYMLYYYNEHGATSAYEIYLAHGGQEGLFERVEFTYE